MDKESAWNYGLGMIKVDGLIPSKEFLNLVESEKKGDLTNEDILAWLSKKYEKYESGNGEQL